MTHFVRLHLNGAKRLGATRREAEAPRSSLRSQRNDSHIVTHATRMDDHYYKDTKEIRDSVWSSMSHNVVTVVSLSLFSFSSFMCPHAQRNKRSKGLGVCRHKKKRQRKG